MIWLARLALRLATRTGLRWMVVAAVGRLVLSRLRRGAVERAAAELEARAHEKLPAPAARAVSALPPGVRRAGGSAVVATRTARRAVSGGRRASRATRTGSAQVTARLDSARETVARIRSETDDGTRRLRSRYLAATVGPDAATDALLDVRPGGPIEPGWPGGPIEPGWPDGPIEPGSASPDPGSADAVTSNDDPHARVAPPVTPGRRRARRGPVPGSNRPRRSYRPGRKPWD